MKAATVAILAVLCLVVPSQADTAYNVGQALGNLLLGSCAALQANPDNVDTTSDCYIACQKSQTAVQNAFDTSKYSGQTYNIGDFTQFGNIFLIKLSTQFEKCNYLVFLQNLDNRFSNTSFLAGTGGKLATEGVYYFIFGTKTEAIQSAINIYDAFRTSDWSGVGKHTQLLFSSLTNFESSKYKP